MCKTRGNPIYLILALFYIALFIVFSFLCDCCPRYVDLEKRIEVIEEKLDFKIEIPRRYDPLPNPFPLPGGDSLYFPFEFRGIQLDKMNSDSLLLYTPGNE